MFSRSTLISATLISITLVILVPYGNKRLRVLRQLAPGSQKFSDCNPRPDAYIFDARGEDHGGREVPAFHTTKNSMDIRGPRSDEYLWMEEAFMRINHDIPQGHLDGHLDDYPDRSAHEENLLATPRFRRLSALSALIGTFYPLTCNVNLNSLNCGLNITSSLTFPPPEGKPFTIPCGTCYIFDLGPNVSLPTGLNVMGKLVFPVNYKTTIYTSSVVVQGEMVIRSNSSVVSPDNISVQFELTGTNDTVIDTSSSAPNTLSCNASVCNMGKKPFIVAGGKLDIRAMPDTCMTWTKIKDTILQKPLKNSSLFSSTVYPPVQCPSQTLSLFENSSVVFPWNLTGIGIGYNLTAVVKSSCIIPNQNYILSARLKMDKADGSSGGFPVLCAVNGTGCPRFRTRVGLLPNDETRSTLYTVPSRYAGTYGETVHFTATTQWTPSQLNQTAIKYWMLYFDQIESEILLTVTDLSISLPKPSSYLNPTDVCSELLPNGDAEGNGFNPYPFYAQSSSEKVLVMNENGNNFFRLEKRLSYSSTITSKLDTRCLDLGVSYIASAKVRINSDFPQEYYVILRYQRNDGSWNDRTIMQCPGQSRLNSWVRCSSEFIVDTDLNLAVNVYWRLYLSNTRDGHLYTIDYDDLSIRFVKGYVDKIVVNSADASCWGAGSDLHITSSTFFNSDGARGPNGYTGSIVEVNNTGDGLRVIQINPAPTLPIMTLSDSLQYAAEVALLTRNVVIKGSFDEGAGKGGYFQVLHSPSISQIIQGVQYRNMGRVGEASRFALQLLYSGMVNGSYIAKNAIIDANHRGIVIEGTSNITIFDNVCLNVSGHAFYVGDQSQDNIFERNIGSQTKTISSTLTISGENDYDAAAFYSRFPPNSFILNVAAGNMENGFYFSNSNIRSESGAELMKSPAASYYSMGAFKSNIAHSNQYSGFALFHYAQGGGITFESIVSYRNRDRGLILYNAHRSTLSSGIITDNRCGIEARYSDGLILVNTSIRGFSTEARNLTRPPYFWKLCPSTSAVVGYSLNTYISSSSESRGATMKNLVFSDFDSSADCPNSVAIDLNSYDITDRHFDFLSSFQNTSIIDARTFRINACGARNRGIDDVVLTDVDGTLFNSASNSAPYSIVSNVYSLTAFATNTCISYPDMCIALCPSSCLRTVDFTVEQSGTKNWALQLLKGNENGTFDGSTQQIVVGSKYRYDGNESATIDSMEHESNVRKFSVSVPIGFFQAQFVDETGSIAWPRFVLETWKTPPNCVNHPTTANLTLVEAPLRDGDCLDLIKNRDFEAGLTYLWHHRDSGFLRFSEGQGRNSSIALLSKRADYNDGVGQNFDTRCLRTNDGNYYEIKAWVRLLLNGSYVSCDPNSSVEYSRCPSATFKVVNFSNRTTKDAFTSVYQGDKAKMLVPYEKDSYNLVHGIFKIDSTLSSAQRVYFYLEKFNRSFDLLLDDVSITRFNVDIGCDGDLIQNGNFYSGTNIYWGIWSSAKIEMLSGLAYSNGYAMMAYDRSTSDAGLMQNIYRNCLVAGDRYAAVVRYKLLTNASQPFTCNMTSNNITDSCLLIRFYTSKNGTSSYAYIGETNAAVNNDDWTYATGLYVVESNAVRADRLSVYFSAINPLLSIVYDSVSFTKISSSCQTLVLNPMFNEGKTSFYKADDPTKMKVRLEPGFGGSGYAALIYDRSSSSRSLVQNLDKRCFYANAEYTITSKFRLLNNTFLSSGVSCDTNARSGATQCPSLRLYGSDCVNGTTMSLIFWSIWQWSASSFNNFTTDIIVSPSFATCKSVQLYIGYNIDPKWAVLVDDVQITTKSSLRPTPSPTSSPISQQALPTISPTASTTLAPTTSAISCPNVSDGPISLASNTVMINVSNVGVLCTLVKVSTGDNGEVKDIIPLARSYDGFMWEPAAGDYAAKLVSTDIYQCYSHGCQFWLPQTTSSELFQLRSYEYILPEIDQLARMLERTSFGVTQSDLRELSSLSDPSGGNSSIDAVSYKMAHWVKMQMTTNMSSHREFWRQHANPRLQGPSSVGLPTNPCDVGSRFRRFSFVRNDYLWYTKNNIRFSSPYYPIIISMNGVPRTVVSNVSILNAQYSNYTLNSTHDYLLCGSPEEKVGGRVYITLENGSCQAIANPAVNFDGFNNLATYIITVAGPEYLSSIDTSFTSGDEFILKLPLIDPACSMLPNVVEVSDPPIFSVLSDGSWLQFDPRLRLELNTPDSPRVDGGGQDVLYSSKSMACTNVPRTFLNEKQCTMSHAPLTCGAVSSTPDVRIQLEEPTLLTLFNLTGRYVYGLKGLTVIDQFNNMIAHPCTPGLRSRWLLKDLSSCNTTDIFNLTNSTLSDLLWRSTDTNPYFRDITFPQSGALCDVLDTNPAIELLVAGKCWLRVHPAYLSVYDMTYWTMNNTHPGNLYAATHNHSNPIKKWAENGQGIMVFPSKHPYSSGFDHPITRWDENYRKFIYVGRFGDSLRLVDLPNELRKDQVLAYYGASGQINGGGIIVCGSPGEIPNDQFKGSQFEVATGLHNPPYDIGDNRKFVWTMQALGSKDQFRQRIAWALAQILVVVKSAISTEDEKTEWFLNYYDIFVRHAFGNYRDILREVSYSSLMAENLSYLGSKSAAYVMENYHYVAFPDENFAREIMQLFTIGIIKLKQDGTPYMDSQGNTILSYTNEHVMSFARAWTGFDLQPRRGNIEGYDNRIDPMRIQPHWRDKFPKSNLNDGYIGDGVALCVDLPPRMFLRKGASYRFLGSSSLPQLMDDPAQLANDPTTKRVILDHDSALRALLCNADSNGICRFANIVIVSTNLACQGIECSVDTVRVVQITNNTFYEYVPPACVQQSFFSSATKVATTSRDSKVICADPKLPVAGAACCNLGSSTSYRSSLYDVERLTMVSARNRCLKSGMDLCDYSSISYNSSQSYKVTGFHWTTVPCIIKAKINPSGYVALVHEPGNYLTKVLHVNDDSENYFKVYWQDNFPKASNMCDGLCDVIGDSCLCGTLVITSPVYVRMPASINDALSRLRIGSPDPESFDVGTFYPFTDPITNITVYTKKLGIIQADSIFIFTDNIGRKQILKNAAETVQIRSSNGFYSGYSFRNAPHFMSLLYSETNTRDAQYETEATLDHYFFQDNTAPFLSKRLIQRFVSSNPSPRYIKTVAAAFKSGSYQFGEFTYGTGTYGDLAATMAAVVLDREARSVLLDSDPSSGFIREPLLRYTSLLRSMEFTAIASQPVVRMYNMETVVGQMAHEFASVFSFLLPEFKPSGVIGNRGFVSPEAALLDTPKIIGLLNGALSVINYGLSACNGGLGPSLSGGCYEGLYNSASGFLRFNVSIETAYERFFETFEGPSLVGGFDTRWVGKKNGAFTSVVTNDPQDSSNHVLKVPVSSTGDIYSPLLSTNETQGSYVVKFRYYTPGPNRGGGCIGLFDVNFVIQKLFYCDWTNLGNTSSAGNWLTCQYQIPAATSSFRIGLYDAGGSIGDAYFDNIQVVPGSGTSCSGVSLEPWTPPGVVGYSKVIVDTLATLLTAGRLSEAHRDKIRTAYDNSGSANDGLRMAQQLIVTTAEFHSANTIKSAGGNRDNFAFPSPSGRPYRAVIFVMFAGGCDSFNMLTPYSCTIGKDLYGEYLDVRQQVALSKQKVLPVNASNQVCESFGIHSSLKAVRQLYLDGDLSFFANTGVLTAPVTKFNYNTVTKTQLFAHDQMQLATKLVDPLQQESNTGVLGRMTDILVKSGYNVGSFSLDRYSVSVVGQPGVSSSPMIVSSGNGVIPFYASTTLRGLLPALHEQSQLDSGYFSETWSDSLMRSIDVNDLLSTALLNVSTTTSFPNTYFGRQLRTVSRLIATREQRGVDTDTFYVEIGGFDTHSDVEINLVDRFTEVDGAIAAFASEMKVMGVWNDVTVIQTSDFSRTLAPNSGDGTDHAWGGNYMIFGGDVKGGNIFGKYPADLTDNGPLGLGRGRLIPTTPWDAVFHGIAEWLSISGLDLDYVCPNRNNFNSSILFRASDLFESGRRKSPTSSPATKQPASPTKRPSKKPSSLPTRKPTHKPSTKPTSRFPTRKPTPSRPTGKPTRRPSRKPSRKPSRNPSAQKTRNPTRRPSRKPTRKPSFRTRRPSRKPTVKPTPRRPTRKPTPRRPTRKPTPRRPTRKPTPRRPTRKPTPRRPTRKPTRQPSKKP